MAKSTPGPSGDTKATHRRAATARQYRGELEGHLYAAASSKPGYQQASGWLCAVCHWAPASVLDHCHEHGYVRAPVCPSCNTHV